MLYGIFLEDLNYAIDGGLNANLLNNYSFDGVYMDKHGHSELRTVLTRKVRARPMPDGTRHWRVTGGRLTVCDDTPLADGARFGRVVSEGTTVVANDGYPGGNPAVPAHAARPLTFSAWIRSHDFRGDLTARIVDAAGVVASAQIGRASAQWEHISATLRPVRESLGTFELVLSGAGTVDIDDMVLVPDDHWGAGDPRWSQGVFRRDLVEVIADLHPTFMRFPGGCIVEGLGLENRYDWKRTVGPLWSRRRQHNLWASRTADGNYGQSFQVGFYEYFLLSEDLAMEPVPVVNAGLACQMRSRDVMPLDHRFEQLIQDVLDLIDWATADPSASSWAALRAAAGHPEPFPLRFIEIGNENFGALYLERFDRIRSAVEAHRPGMTVILSSGISSAGKRFSASWRHARGLYDDGGGPVIVNEHYYHSPRWFLRNNRRYDRYPRGGPKVFVGEYAAHLPSAGIDIVDQRFASNTFGSALAEAAYLTGIERNSDVVAMTAYAPLLFRVGHQQWQHNLIGFTPTTVLRTANFHVQSLFASTVGDRIVPIDANLPDGVFASATTTDAKMYVKLVNTTATGLTLELNLPGAPDGAVDVTLITASPRSRNRIAPDGTAVEEVAPERLGAVCRNEWAVVQVPPRAVLSVAIPR